MKTKLLSIFIFIFLINNFAFIGKHVQNNSKIVSDLIKIQSPVLSLFAACNLQTEIVKGLNNVSNTPLANEQGDENQDKTKADSSADFSINLFQKTSKLKDKPDSLNGSAGQRALISIGHIDAMLSKVIRGSPTNGNVIIILVFLLFYLIKLSLSNLPNSIATFRVLNILTRLNKIGRVFLFQGGFKKVIALFTLSCFIFSFILSDAMHAASYLKKNINETKKVEKIWDDLLIPANAGRVTSGKYHGSDKVIVNIQDLHCHYDAQKNISRLISILDKECNLKKIYVEGASGKVDTAWLSSIKDQALKSNIVNTLFKQGKLAGTEYYSINQNKPPVLMGMEDNDIYEKNLLRLNQILNNKDKYKKAIAIIERDVNGLKKKHFKAQNRRFEKVIKRHKKGKLSAVKYYSLLKKYVEKLNTEPKKFNMARINMNQYENVSGYLELMDRSKKLNYKAVSRQMQLLVRNLKQKISYNAYKSIVEKTENFNNLDVLYTHLPKILKDCKFNIKQEYPQLHDFFIYSKKLKEINPLIMIQEEKILVSEIRLALVENVTEDDISHIVVMFEYLKDFLNNKLTYDEYKYFSAKLHKFAILLKKYSIENAYSELKPDIDLINSYYESNIKRNQIFIEKILDDEKNVNGFVKSLSSRGPPHIDDKDRLLKTLKQAREVIVVVSGGFHSKGIEELLTKQNISNLTITPNITKSTQKSEKLYSELIKQQTSLLEFEALAIKMLSTMSPMTKFESIVDAEIRNKIEQGQRSFVKLIKEHNGDISRLLEDIRLEWNRNDNLKADFGKIVEIIDIGKKDNGKYYFDVNFEYKGKINFAYVPNAVNAIERVCPAKPKKPIKAPLEPDSMVQGVEPIKLAHKWEWLLNIFPMPTRVKTSKIWHWAIKLCGINDRQLETIKHGMVRFPKKLQLFDFLSYMGAVALSALSLFMGLSIVPVVGVAPIIVIVLLFVAIALLSVVSLKIFTVSRGKIFYKMHELFISKKYESEDARQISKDGYISRGKKYTMRAIWPASSVIASSAGLMILIVKVVGLAVFYGQVIILSGVLAALVLGINRSIIKHKKRNFAIIGKLKEGKKITPDSIAAKKESEIERLEKIVKQAIEHPTFVNVLAVGRSYITLDREGNIHNITNDGLRSHLPQICNNDLASVKFIYSEKDGVYPEVSACPVCKNLHYIDETGPQGYVVKRLLEELNKPIETEKLSKVLTKQSTFNAYKNIKNFFNTWDVGKLPFGWEEDLKYKKLRRKVEIYFAPIWESVSFIFNPIGFYRSHRQGYEKTWKEWLLVFVSYTSVILSWILVTIIPLVSLLIYAALIMGTVIQKTKSTEEEKHKKNMSKIWGISVGAGLLITYLSTIVWIFLPIVFGLNILGHSAYNMKYGTQIFKSNLKKKMRNLKIFYYLNAVVIFFASMGLFMFFAFFILLTMSFIPFIILFISTTIIYSIVSTYMVMSGSRKLNFKILNQFEKYIPAVKIFKSMNWRPGKDRNIRKFMSYFIGKFGDDFVLENSESLAKMGNMLKIDYSGRKKIKSMVNAMANAFGDEFIKDNFEIIIKLIEELPEKLSKKEKGIIIEPIFKNALPALRNNIKTKTDFENMGMALMELPEKGVEPYVFKKDMVEFIEKYGEEFVNNNWRVVLMLLKTSGSYADLTLKGGIDSLVDNFGENILIKKEAALTKLCRKVNKDLFELLYYAVPELKKQGVIKEDNFDEIINILADLCVYAKKKKVVTETVFKYEFLVMEGILSEENLKQMGEGLIDLTAISNGHIYLDDTMRSFKEEGYGKEFIKTHWKDIFELGKSAKNDSQIKYILSFGLPRLLRNYEVAFVKKHWNELVKMGLSMEGNAGALFGNALVAFKNKINDENLNKICSIFIKLYKSGKEKGVKTDDWFCYGLIHLAGIITEGNLEQIGEKLISLAKLLQNNIKSELKKYNSSLRTGLFGTYLTADEKNIKSANQTYQAALFIKGIYESKAKITEENLEKIGKDLVYLLGVCLKSGIGDIPFIDNELFYIVIFYIKSIINNAESLESIFEKYNKLTKGVLNENSLIFMAYNNIDISNVFEKFDSEDFREDFIKFKEAFINANNKQEESRQIDIKTFQNKYIVLAYKLEEIMPGYISHMTSLLEQSNNPYVIKRYLKSKKTFLLDEFSLKIAGIVEKGLIDTGSKIEENIKSLSKVIEEKEERIKSVEEQIKKQNISLENILLKISNMTEEEEKKALQKKKGKIEGSIKKLGGHYGRLKGELTVLKQLTDDEWKFKMEEKLLVKGEKTKKRRKINLTKFAKLIDILSAIYELDTQDWLMHSLRGIQDRIRDDVSSKEKDFIDTRLTKLKEQLIRQGLLGDLGRLAGLSEEKIETDAFNKLHLPFLSRFNDAFNYIEKHYPGNLKYIEFVMREILKGNEFRDSIENIEQKDTVGRKIASHNTGVREAMNVKEVKAERYLGWNEENRVKERKFMYYEKSSKKYDSVKDVQTITKYLTTVLSYSLVQNGIYENNEKLMKKVESVFKKIGLEFKEGKIAVDEKAKKRDILGALSNEMNVKILLELTKILKLFVENNNGSVSERETAMHLVQHVEKLYSKINDKEYLADLSKKRIHFMIRPIMRGEPGKVLHMGGFTDCCLAMNSNNYPHEMVNRLIDEGMNVIEVIDEQSGLPVACLWLYIAEDGSLVIQNLEIESEYEKVEPIMDRIGEEMIIYAEYFAIDIGAPRLLIGESGHGKYFHSGFIRERYSESEIPFGLKKIGGHLPGRNYLDSEGKKNAYLVMDFKIANKILNELCGMVDNIESINTSIETLSRAAITFYRKEKLNELSKNEIKTKINGLIKQIRKITNVKKKKTLTYLQLINALEELKYIKRKGIGSLVALGENIIKLIAKAASLDGGFADWLIKQISGITKPENLEGWLGLLQKGSINIQKAHERLYENERYCLSGKRLEPYREKLDVISKKLIQWGFHGFEIVVSESPFLMTTENNCYSGATFSIAKKKFMVNKAILDRAPPEDIIWHEVAEYYVMNFNSLYEIPAEFKEAYNKYLTYLSGKPKSIESFHEFLKQNYKGQKLLLETAEQGYNHDNPEATLAKKDIDQFFTSAEQLQRFVGSDLAMLLKDPALTLGDYLNAKETVFCLKIFGSDRTTAIQEYMRSLNEIAGLVKRPVTDFEEKTLAELILILQAFQDWKVLLQQRWSDITEGYHEYLQCTQGVREVEIPLEEKAQLSKADKLLELFPGNDNIKVLMKHSQCDLYNALWNQEEVIGALAASLSNDSNKVKEAVKELDRNSNALNNFVINKYLFNMDTSNNLLPIKNFQTDETIGYAGTPFGKLRQLFAYLGLSEEDTIYDLGSGFGEVVLWAGLTTKIGRAVGIELVQGRNDIATRVSKFLQLSNTEFVSQDVRQADFWDGTCFFLFDPFSEETRQAVTRKLMEIARTRNIVIAIWGGPVFYNYFERQREKGWLEKIQTIREINDPKYPIVVYRTCLAQADPGTVAERLGLAEKVDIHIRSLGENIREKETENLESEEDQDKNTYNIEINDLIKAVFAAFGMGALVSFIIIGIMFVFIGALSNIVILSIIVPLLVPGFYMAFVLLNVVLVKWLSNNTKLEYFNAFKKIVKNAREKSPAVDKLLKAGPINVISSKINSLLEWLTKARPRRADPGYLAPFEGIALKDTRPNAWLKHQRYIPQEFMGLRRRHTAWEIRVNPAVYEFVARQPLWIQKIILSYTGIVSHEASHLHDFDTPLKTNVTKESKAYFIAQVFPSFVGAFVGLIFSCCLGAGILASIIIGFLITFYLVDLIENIFAKRIIEKKRLEMETRIDSDTGRVLKEEIEKSKEILDDPETTKDIAKYPLKRLKDKDIISKAGDKYKALISEILKFIPEGIKFYLYDDFNKESFGNVSDSENAIFLHSSICNNETAFCQYSLEMLVKKKIIELSLSGKILAVINKGNKIGEIEITDRSVLIVRSKSNKGKKNNLRYMIELFSMEIFGNYAEKLMTFENEYKLLLEKYSNEENLLLNPSASSLFPVYNELKEIFENLRKTAGIEGSAFWFLDQNEISAFAMPKMKIVAISAGLLRKIENLTKDSIAFVLAHEIRHLSQKAKGDDTDKNGVVRGFAQEIDSDYFALDLMNKAGYNVTEATKFFESVNGAEAYGVKGRLAKMGLDLKDLHINTEKRIKILKDLVNSRNWGVTAEKQYFSEEFVELLDEVAQTKKIFEKVRYLESFSELSEMLEKMSASPALKKYLNVIAALGVKRIFRSFEYEIDFDEIFKQKGIRGDGLIFLLTLFHHAEWRNLFEGKDKEALEKVYRFKKYKTLERELNTFMKLVEDKCGKINSSIIYYTLNNEARESYLLWKQEDEVREKSEEYIKKYLKKSINHIAIKPEHLTKFQLSGQGSDFKKEVYLMYLDICMGEILKKKVWDVAFVIEIINRLESLGSETIGSFYYYKSNAKKFFDKLTESLISSGRYNTEELAGLFFSHRNLLIVGNRFSFNSYVNVKAIKEIFGLYQVNDEFTEKIEALLKDGWNTYRDYGVMWVIAEKFYENISEGNNEYLDFLEFHGGAIAHIYKILSKKHRSSEERFIILDRLLDYAKENNISFPNFDLKSIKKYFKHAVPADEEELNRRLDYVLHKAAITYPQIENIVIHLHGIGKQAKEIIMLVLMFENFSFGTEGLSAEEKSIISKIINTIYRKKTEDNPITRHLVQSKIKHSKNIFDTEVSLKIQEEVLYEKALELGLELFLREIEYSDRDIVLTRKINQLNEMAAVKIGVAAVPRFKGDENEESKGYPGKIAKYAITENYEKYFNKMFGLPFYIDRTYMSDTKEAFFRDEVLDFIFKTGKSFDECVALAIKHLPSGVISNYILLSLFLREAEKYYPQNDVFDLRFIKNKIQENTDLAEKLNKILLLLVPDNKLTANNMALVMHLLEKERSNKQSGIGSEDDIFAHLGDRKLENIFATRRVKIRESIRSIFVILKTLLGYIKIRMYQALSTYLYIRAAEKIFIERNISIKFLGKLRKNFVNGEISPKILSEELQRDSELDKYIINKIRDKYDIRAENIGNMSEIQIMFFINRHVINDNLVSGLLINISDIKDKKKRKHAEKLYEKVKNKIEKPVRKKSDYPGAYWDRLREYEKYIGKIAELNVFLMQIMYPKSIKINYDKAVTYAVIRNRFIEKLLHTIYNSISPKMFQKIVVKYLAKRRKSRNIEKIDILYFDYNHPGKYAQLDAVLPDIFEKELMLKINSNGDFAGAISFVSSKFVNSQPARDRYFEAIFDRQISRIVLYASEENAPKDIMAMVDELRDSIKLLFSPYLKNHYSFECLNLEVENKILASLMDEINAVEKYFPDKSYFRDDILKSLWERVLNFEEAERLKVLFYSDRSNILENSDVANKVFVEEKLKVLFENLPAKDKKDFMLWILGMQKIPLFLKQWEELLGVSFEKIKNFYQISQKTQRYKFAGESERNMLIEEMFLGGSGILSDSRLFESFMDNILKYLLNNTNLGKSIKKSVLKKIFKAVIKNADKRKKLEIVKALSLNLASIFQEGSEGLNEYDVIVKMMESLGIIGIKIAQMIGFSSDMEVPEELKRKFKDMGSSARPLTKQVLFESLTNLGMKGRIKSIGELLGSASIKIVFEAVLNSGEKIALKVKRPAVEHDLEEDIRMFKSVIKHLRKLKVKVPEGFEERASGNIRKDADFENEIENTGKLEKQLEEINKEKNYSLVSSNTPVIFAVPAYFEGSNSKVILSELVSGYDLDKEHELIEKGIVSAKELVELKDVIFDFLMTQLFEKGFYLGDPHGANFRIVRENGIIKVYLIDIGDMENLEKNKGKYKRLLWGLACLKKNIKTTGEEEFIDEAIFFTRAGHLIENKEMDELLEILLKKVPKEYAIYDVTDIKKAIKKFKIGVVKYVITSKIRKILRMKNRHKPGDNENIDKRESAGKARTGLNKPIESALSDHVSSEEFHEPKKVQSLGKNIIQLVARAASLDGGFADWLIKQISGITKPENLEGWLGLLQKGSINIQKAHERMYEDEKYLVKNQDLTTQQKDNKAMIIKELVDKRYTGYDVIVSRNPNLLPPEGDEYSLATFSTTKKKLMVHADFLDRAPPRMIKAKVWHEVDEDNALKGEDPLFDDFLMNGLHLPEHQQRKLTKQEVILARTSENYHKYLIYKKDLDQMELLAFGREIAKKYRLGIYLKTVEVVYDALIERENDVEIMKETLNDAIRAYGLKNVEEFKKIKDQFSWGALVVEIYDNLNEIAGDRNKQKKYFIALMNKYTIESPEMFDINQGGEIEIGNINQIPATKVIKMIGWIEELKNLQDLISDFINNKEIEESIARFRVKFFFRRLIDRRLLTRLTNILVPRLLRKFLSVQEESACSALVYLLSEIFNIIPFVKGRAEIVSLALTNHISLGVKMGEKLLVIDYSLPEIFVLDLGSHKWRKSQNVREEKYKLISGTALEEEDERVDEVYKEINIMKISSAKPVFWTMIGLSAGFASKVNKNFLKQTIKYCKKALEMNPKESQIWEILGIAYYKQKNYEEAINCFQKAIEINPKYVHFWNHIGEAYQGKGNNKKAIEYYQKALEINPSDKNALFSIGNIYLQQDEYEQALRYFKRVSKIDPKTITTWNNMGVAYYKQENIEEAIKCYQKALEIDPKYKYALDNLEIAYEPLDRHEETIKYCQIASEIDTDDKYLQDKLKELEEEMKKSKERSVQSPGKNKPSLTTEGIYQKYGYKHAIELIANETVKLGDTAKADILINWHKAENKQFIKDWTKHMRRAERTASWREAPSFVLDPVGFLLGHRSDYELKHQKALNVFSFSFMIVSWLVFATVPWIFLWSYIANLVFRTTIAVIQTKGIEKLGIKEKEKQKVRTKGVVVISAVSIILGIVAGWLASTALTVVIISWVASLLIGLAFTSITFLINIFGHSIYNRLFGTGTKADAALVKSAKNWQKTYTYNKFLKTLKKNKWNIGNIKEKLGFPENVSIVKIFKFYDEKSCKELRTLFEDEIIKPIKKNPETRKIDICEKFNISMFLFNKILEAFEMEYQNIKKAVIERYPSWEDFEKTLLKNSWNLDSTKSELKIFGSQNRIIVYYENESNGEFSKSLKEKIIEYLALHLRKNPHSG
ncbi:tetratricopeptide repeat protein [Elusimicrobiota bacterium]